MKHSLKQLIPVLSGIGMALAGLTVSNSALALPVLQLGGGTYVAGDLPDGTTDTSVLTGTQPLVVVVDTADDAGRHGQDFDDVQLVFSYDPGQGPADAVIQLYGVDGTLVGEASSALSVAAVEGLMAPSGLPNAAPLDTTDVVRTLSLGSFLFETAELWNTAEAEETDAMGDVRSYTVVIGGITGSVHIDAVGYFGNRIVAVAPASHDADYVTAVPELPMSGGAPALAFLAGLGILLTTSRRRSA